MSDAVEPLDLGVIRERVENAAGIASDRSYPGEARTVAAYMAKDGRALLAEVERLRAALTTARRDAWDEGCAAGLSRGLDIAEMRTGPIDLVKVPPPPTSPYAQEEDR